MPLVLSVPEGSHILVGDKKINVDRVLTCQRYQVSVEGAFINKYEITNRSNVEVLPDVHLSAGLGSSSVAKMVVTAPKNVLILREELADG